MRFCTARAAVEVGLPYLAMLLQANDVANTDCAAFGAIAVLLTFRADPTVQGKVAELGAALQKLIVRRQSKIAGWHRFCTEIGLSTDRVQHLPGLFCKERDRVIDILYYALTDAMALSLEPDESQIKARHTEWRECWNELR